MMNNVLAMTQEIVSNEEARINSITLVEIINQFRELEGNHKELRHDTFMEKIRTELKILESLGLNSLQNILESDYTNSRGKKYPCYQLNRNGMLMLLNSESTLVRYKTVEYIDKLEKESKQLKSDNTELYQIATSDEKRNQREYKANVIKFGWKNIRLLLEECTYKNLEDTVVEIIDFHTVILKKKDRSYDYDLLTKTEYKVAVRDRVDGILANIYNTTLNGTLRIVAKELQEKTVRKQLETSNRKNGQIIKQLNKKIDNSVYYPRESEFIVVDSHGFSHNYMYDVINGRMVKSVSYKNWIKNFDYNNIVDVDYWDDVDFTKPIELFINYVSKDEMDIRNFDKSFIDMLFNRIYEVDDNIVQTVHSQRVGVCDNFDGGKIGFYLRNVKEVA